MIFSAFGLILIVLVILSVFRLLGFVTKLAQETREHRSEIHQQRILLEKLVEQNKEIIQIMKEK